MWQAFWAIAYKELVHATRNSGGIKRVLTFQLMNFIMLAWIDLTVRNLPSVVVDQDHTAESRILVEHLRATHSFDFKYATSSIEQARAHINAGRASVAILIPPDYSRVRAAGGTAQVLALVDGSDSVSSGQAVTALRGVTARMNLEAQEELAEAPPSVTPHSILLFNPQGKTSSFMLPGLLAMSLGTGYSGFAMRRLIAERMGGNLERLLMTPLNYTGMILGKMAPWVVLGLFNATVFLLVARYGFDVPIRGSLALLIGALTLYIFTVLAIGSLIASGSKTLSQANSLWSITVFPAFALSGYIFPLASLPKWLLPISYAMPQTHFIEVMRGICLRGASASELAPDLVYLLIAPLVLSVAAAIRFARSVLD